MTHHAPHRCPWSAVLLLLRTRRVELSGLGFAPNISSKIRLFVPRVLDPSTGLRSQRLLFPSCTSWALPHHCVYSATAQFLFSFPFRGLTSAGVEPAIPAHPAGVYRHTQGHMSGGGERSKNRRRKQGGEWGNGKGTVRDSPHFYFTPKVQNSQLACVVLLQIHFPSTQRAVFKFLHRVLLSAHPRRLHGWGIRFFLHQKI